MKEKKSPVLLFVVLGVIAAVVVAGFFLSRSSDTVSENPEASPSPSVSASGTPSPSVESTGPAPLPSGLPGEDVGDVATAEEMQQWTSENGDDIVSLITTSNEMRTLMSTTEDYKDFFVISDKYLEMKETTDRIKETCPDGATKILLENLSISLQAMVDITKLLAESAEATLDESLSEEERIVSGTTLGESYKELQGIHKTMLGNLLEFIRIIKPYDE
jgi:hypothetical protein